MKRRYIYIVLPVLLLILTACSSKDTGTGGNKVKEDLLSGKMDNLTGNEFLQVGEGDEMLLLLNPSTGTIRWQSKTDGTFLDTKLFEGEGVSDRSKSDVIAYYYSGSSQDKYAKTSNMNSYKLSVEMDSFYFRLIDNGVRIIYEIGDNSINHRYFPTYIREERMNELVLQYLNESQAKIVKKQFTLTKSGIYARNSSEDYPLTGLGAKELYNLFYEVGHYTLEELQVDNGEFEVDVMPEKQVIVLAIDYYLDGNDLMVRVPTDQIQFDENYPLKSLDVLPYFLATADKDGYMFIPDGSGALIYLDNAKKSEYQYSSRYYGGDRLVGADTYNPSQAMMMLPVLGLKTSNYAVLGIIEKGAETATLSAYISGYYSNENFCRLSLNFAIREEQSISTSAAVYTEYYMKRTTDDYYKDDIVIRYRFLPEEEANYVAMAGSYRDYLMEKGILKEKEAENEAPIFLELLGATDRKKDFCGIPYMGTQSLTTFREARDILSCLNEAGVHNIKLIYSGMINGGLNQRSVENLKPVSTLGGKKGFKALIDYAESIGAEVFPNIKLQTAYTRKGLSADELSYFLNGERALLYEFDPVQRQPLTGAKYKQYVINPGYLNSYIEKCAASLNRLGIDAVASDDFLSFIGSNYRKGSHISQTTAKAYYTQALESLSDGRTLLLSNPVDLAYGYTDYIMDLPAGNSGMRILDAYVPFVQLVLDGCISYSLPAINRYSFNVADDVLAAVETKSLLKFTLMKEDMESLRNTEQDDYFMVEFDYWKESIANLYGKYNEFYKKVKDSRLIGHEIVGRNNDLRIVTYSNGVKVYLNYSDEDALVSDVWVNTHSFTVK